MELAFERINKMLKMAHTKARVFPPTQLYNEGWMLRIVLSIQSEGIDCLPFSFQHGARWYSEASLFSPFLARTRSGDPLAERHTHPDGVIGHFDIGSGTKTGLLLTADSTQFVVTEAKIPSKLEEGTTKIKDYDQAARTVACMAWTIRQSNKIVNDLEFLGFYVIAPEKRIADGVFSSQIRKSSIRKKVKLRVSGYVDDHEKHTELQRWYQDFFLPTLDNIEIDCVSWESIMKKIDNPSIEEFYKQCRIFNA